MHNEAIVRRKQVIFASNLYYLQCNIERPFTRKNLDKISYSQLLFPNPLHFCRKLQTTLFTHTLKQKSKCLFLQFVNDMLEMILCDRKGKIYYFIQMYYQLTNKYSLIQCWHFQTPFLHSLVGNSTRQPHSRSRERLNHRSRVKIGRHPTTAATTAKPHQQSPQNFQDIRFVRLSIRQYVTGCTKQCTRNTHVASSCVGITISKGSQQREEKAGATGCVRYELEVPVS